MEVTFRRPDAPSALVQAALARLATGQDGDAVESERLDCKADPTGADGDISHSFEADKVLGVVGPAVACMSNTSGGGAVLFGVADRGSHSGTAVPIPWLRKRILETTGATVQIDEYGLGGVRVLALLVGESGKPLSYRKQASRHRVGAQCVPLDLGVWQQVRARSAPDPSAMASAFTVDDATSSAIEAARRYLRESGEDAAVQLAEAAPRALLERIGAVNEYDPHQLNHAGAWLFAAAPAPGIHYLYRPTPGADSDTDYRGSVESLLQQIATVEQLLQTKIGKVHVGTGFARGQVDRLPFNAAREAVLNGIAHRNWEAAEPTVVEHVGDRLRVDSPGALLPGITPANIMTHVSVPRYPRLAELLHRLRLVERQGIGVDRMVEAMLRRGLEPPTVEATDLRVAVTLHGGEPDPSMLSLASEPTDAGHPLDLDALIIVDRATRSGWVDATTVAAYLQRSAPDAGARLESSAQQTVDGEPVIVALRGVPAGTTPVYRPSDRVRRRLPARHARVQADARRAQVVQSFAQARGRISTTEAGDLLGLSYPVVLRLLQRLADEGILAPSGTGGRGHHYLPVDPEDRGTRE
ncbi:MAG: ATP-binding protein [Candidatus Nanopelagicales bacterium]|nr:ATP-binding protein [Candidatus Nanopelagicales bacterium]